jgi:hypothetical protein
MTLPSSCQRGAPLLGTGSGLAGASPRRMPAALTRAPRVSEARSRIVSPGAVPAEQGNTIPRTPQPPGVGEGQYKGKGEKRDGGNLSPTGCFCEALFNLSHFPLFPFFLFFSPLHLAGVLSMQWRRRCLLGREGPTILQVCSRQRGIRGLPSLPAGIAGFPSDRNAIRESSP